MSYKIKNAYAQMDLRGFVVNIADTDDVREVCSGMYGGKEAYIERECHIYLSYL